MNCKSIRINRNFDYDEFDNYSIESIVFEEGVTEIPEDAFSGCKSLKNVEFPKTLKKFGRYAFEGCRLTSVKIPAGCKVGDCAFDE